MIERLLKEAFTSETNPANFRPDKYLGMSMIGGCPTAAYDSFFGNRDADMRLRYYGHAGRIHEEGVRGLLSLAGHVLSKDHYWHHVEASFDSRYRGHIDIILVSGAKLTVIDVKSLDWPKYEMLVRDEKVPYSHEKNVDQVLSYMTHIDPAKDPESKWSIGGATIYTPRNIPYNGWEADELRPGSDPLPFRVIGVAPDIERQAELIARARDLLYTIDSGHRPECTCGYCS